MDKKLKYKNISDQDQLLVGIGTVKAGETVETETVIENPNFELVTEKGKRMVGLDPVTSEPKN